MKPYLLIKDGKLLCAFVPDEPRFWPDQEIWDKFLEAKAEAIANALPVINPQVFVDFYNRGLGTFKQNELIAWNGGVEVIHHDTGGDHVFHIKEFVRLSLPDSKDIFDPEVFIVGDKETQEQLWDEVATDIYCENSFKGYDKIKAMLISKFILTRK